MTTYAPRVRTALTLLVKILGLKKDETITQKFYILTTVVIDILLEFMHIEFADLVFDHGHILVSLSMTACLSYS